MMNYSYLVYGLVFSLPFPCDPLRAAPPEAAPDVIVVEGKTPECLDAPVISEIGWQAEAQRFLWKGGRRSGRFLVEAGQLVTLERSPRSEARQLAYTFLDSILAAILSQRGLLVLHAGAARTREGAIAISGVSGTGKSTTLAAMLQRGCDMLTDDITTLQLDSDGRVEILPGIPQMHLTEQSVKALHQDISNLSLNRRHRRKVVIPTFAQMSQEPADLRRLYILHPQDSGELRFQRLSGAEKFSALQECIYGPLLPEMISQQFPLMAALLTQVDVLRINRPSGQWSADRIAAEILYG